MGPHVETTESAAPALLVLSTESILVRITLCSVDTPSDGMTAHLTRATWGARCGKSARRVLRGGTGTSGLTARLVPTHHGLSHEWLVKFVEHRVADRRVVRLIQKWLNAGVLEDGRRTRVEEGTPQGGSASPLLANVYLHYVFDLWVQAWRQKRAHGDVIVVRFADDIVVGFNSKRDAEQFPA